jgi:hypothetical protein
MSELDWRDVAQMSPEAFEAEYGWRRQMISGPLPEWPDRRSISFRDRLLARLRLFVRRICRVGR